MVLAKAVGGALKARLPALVVMASPDATSHATSFRFINRIATSSAALWSRRSQNQHRASVRIAAFSELTLCVSSAQLIVSAWERWLVTCRRVSGGAMARTLARGPLLTGMVQSKDSPGVARALRAAV